MIAAVLWTAFIVYGLASEGGSIPLFPWLALPGVDKLIHLMLFFVQAALIVWAFASKQRPVWVLAVLWCFVLGGGLEIIQHLWVNGRSGDVLDLLADMLGAGLGIGLMQFFSVKD